MPDLHRVASVQQRGDNTVVVFVQTDSFTSGQEVEVSVYLTQGDTYAAHNEKKRIPLRDPDNPGKPAELHVELPAAQLDPTQDVTVVTRVSEVWPSVLRPDKGKLERYQGVAGFTEQALKAVWTYQETEGKVPGDSTSPPAGNGGGEVPTTPQP